MPERWLALLIEIGAERADELIGEVGDGSLGVESTRRPGGGTRIRIYTTPDESEALRARVARILSAHGATVLAPPRLEEIPDEPWVENYQRSLRPFPVGTTFVVLPGDDLPGALAGNRKPIRLVPGRAFGTGEHPTTRLCVEALERCVAEGARWLDLGTGSGILALVAASLGAAEVIGVDIDPEAVDVARSMLERNAGGERVRLVAGSLGAAGASDLDGVVANISASHFASHANGIRDCLRPGGVLIASGFLPADREAVTAALTAAGLTVYGARKAGDWLALEATRSEASG